MCLIVIWRPKTTRAEQGFHFRGSAGNAKSGVYCNVSNSTLTLCRLLYYYHCHFCHELLASERVYPPYIGVPSPLLKLPCELSYEIISSVRSTIYIWIYIHMNLLWDMTKSQYYARLHRGTTTSQIRLCGFVTWVSRRWCQAWGSKTIRSINTYSYDCNFNCAERVGHNEPRYIKPTYKVIIIQIIVLAPHRSIPGIQWRIFGSFGPWSMHILYLYVHMHVEAGNIKMKLITAPW